MHRIAAAPLLALMLIAGQDARAAETTRIITLSCEGTVRSGPGPGEVQRINSFLGTRWGDAHQPSSSPTPVHRRQHRQAAVLSKEGAR
jgi:hypothetical protein